MSTMSNMRKTEGISDKKNKVVCLLEHFVLLALEQAHEHLLRCILPTVKQWSWKCLHIPGGTLPWVRSGLQVRVTFFSSHSASYQLWPTSTLRRSSRKETNRKKISSSRTVNCKETVLKGKKMKCLNFQSRTPLLHFNAGLFLHCPAGTCLALCSMVWLLDWTGRLGASSSTVDCFMDITSTPWVWCWSLVS